MRPSLNLPIKYKFFDMIAAGVKKEEYRAVDNIQAVRAMLWAKSVPHWVRSRRVAIFRNGYRKDSRAVAVEVADIDLRGAGEAKHPEWGEPKGERDYIVIRLGDVLRVGPYFDVRDFVAELKRAER